MTDYTKIIEALEGAKEGSRELDAAIWWTACPARSELAFHNGSLGLPRSLDHTKPPPAGLGRAAVEVMSPRFTNSLDAALALVREKLPGAIYEIRQSSPGFVSEGAFLALVGFPGEREMARGGAGAAVDPQRPIPSPPGQGGPER